MKRIQLFEFEDLGWFPHLLRTSMTNLLVLLQLLLVTAEVIANLIADVLLKGLKTEKYIWTKGHAKKNNKKQGIYVMGLPI